MKPPAHRLIVVFVALVVFSPAVAGAPVSGESPDIRRLMTPDEFDASGLDKLTTEEIAALNRWIVRFTAKDAPELRQQSEVVKEEIKRVDEEGIRTRIKGEFRGWEGDTVFHLENGQIWKQRLRGRWFYRATSPEVELRKNMMGLWELRVVDADRAIGVSRVN